MKTAMRAMRWALLAACAAASAAAAAISPLEGRSTSLSLGPEPMAPDAAGIGKLIPDVTLQRVGGGETSLHRERGDRGTVVVVRDPECPVSITYGPRLAKLARSYSERGFRFVFIYLNDKVEPWVLAADREALAAPGVFAVRGGFVLASHLGVESTGDVFVLDAGLQLRFRGAVDDQYGLGYTRTAPTHRYLHNALDAVMRGVPVAEPATTAPGCYIDADPAKDGNFLPWPADGALS